MGTVAQWLADGNGGIGERGKAKEEAKAAACEWVAARAWVRLIGSQTRMIFLHDWWRGSREMEWKRRILLIEEEARQEWKVAGARFRRSRDRNKEAWKRTGEMVRAEGAVANVGGVPFCPKGWTYQLRKQKERTRQAEKALGVVAAWMRMQEKGAEEEEKKATKDKKEAQKEMSNADCRLTAAQRDMDTLRQYAVQNEWRNGRVVWGWGSRLNGNARAAQRELGLTCDMVRKALRTEAEGRRRAKDTRATGRAAAIVAGWDPRGWRPTKACRKGPDKNEHGRGYSSDEDGDGPSGKIGGRRRRLRGKQREARAASQNSRRSDGFKLQGKQKEDKACSLEKRVRSAD
jgi:hypothetical protein